MDTTSKTGQDNFKRSPQYKLDELHVQGDVSKSKMWPIEVGHFKLKNTAGEPDGENGYAQKDLGAEVQVVFLKIRRKLSKYWKSPKTSWNTNEHDRGQDVVSLYGVDGGEKVGVADDLRKMYEELRTQQIIYCFVPSLNKVVRLIVKGASLGSENKAEGVMGFYDYLNSFNKDNAHVHEYITILKGIPESDYYTIQFVRGEKLTDERIAKINGLIDVVHDKVTEIKKYYDEKNAKFIAKPAESSVKTIPTIQIDADVDTGSVDPNAIQYPDEEINIEDIPF